ncbi:hypothetical protein CsatA_027837 [Cannabis sativa]
MAVSVQKPTSHLWDTVLEITKSAQERNIDPQLWATQMSSNLNSAGVPLPSVELAHLLVSHICWANHVPITWKFLEKALTAMIVPPILVLALLSARVIPNRQLHPTAYRLYMELLKRHSFSFTSQTSGLYNQKIMKSIDEALHLSQLFGLQVAEPGVLVVEFVFSMVWQLVDAALDDEGLLELTPEKKSRWPTRPQDMEIDGQDCFFEKRSDSEVLHKANTAMAIEIIVEFLKNKVTSRLLYLARRNIPSHWGSFIQRMQFLEANSSVLRSLKHITPDVFTQLTSDTRRLLTRECKTISQHDFHAVLASGTTLYSPQQSHGATSSSFWLPVDLFLEDAMDGSQVAATSAVDTLIGLVKALQVVNGATWHNTFLGLWISALRLIQRERDPREGPVPRLDTCLCMLLSISTLAVTNIVEEEESEEMEEAEQCSTNQRIDKQSFGQRRKDLVTSLQLLGDYEGLLTPPQSVTLAANQAAAKAMMSISGLTVSNGYYDCSGGNDMPINCIGNMRHLIVEACIARNLLDTSAYFWPGYVNAGSNHLPRNLPGQVTGWGAVVKGSPLTPPLVNALIATPASSLAEIEKIYEIALNGSDDEKISAANILCGASLFRGWSIQENVCLFIIGLLSPPVPADYSGSESHLISHAPLFNVLLVGTSSIDCVQIFSLHGLVPLLAGALIPICEVFGSSVPNISRTLPTGEELSCHAVFSNAFTLLLRSWRFDHAPLEHVMGDARTTMGSQLSPEYLLLIRNARLASVGTSAKDRITSRRISKLITFSTEPIILDSFPRLKLWYQQHQKCICSTLSGLVPGTPVHQIVDALLSMMFRKISRGSQPLTPTTSGSSTSSISGPDDSSIRLKVPAWDILEATPFVLDAALTACAHGRLSPRELATGLKDLADYLPATLATILSYFSAEVTRGIWKPAYMNGTDWPSPAANLSAVEQQIKKMLAATGVDVPSLSVGGSSPATLPLPLAALISLTITYKLDKASERALQLIGPATNSLATGCPWPCMPIIASLWSQKVKRWSDFLMFSASQAVFHHNSDAVVQLLKSCFSSTLGLSSYHIHSNGGVGSLLGHGLGSFSGGISPVAPGFLYLRVHRSVRDVMFLTEEIVSLLMFSVKEIVSCGLPKEKVEKLKKTKNGLRYGQVSLATAMSRIKLAASLGASLVWITGGPSLIQCLIKETLPSWFIAAQGSSEPENQETGCTLSVLGGYALAYFAVLSGTFAWGIDPVSPTSKRRSMILGAHLDFLASALAGNISLGCDWATWRAYVSGLLSLMVGCTKNWMMEIDVDILKRLSKGLRQWNEEELALAVLGLGGVGAMGAAAELVIESDF